MWKKYQTYIIFTILVLLMLGGVLFWNKIIDKNEDNKSNDETIDVSDANNVSYVDAELGEDLRITQGYLLNYTTRKSSIWYMSNGYVNKVTKKKDETTIILSNNKDSKTYIEANIDSSKCSIKKGDTVNFVGTINLSNYSIDLANISTDEITYSSKQDISFEDLEKNINLLKSTHFVVSGYIVNDNNEYKLYDSKDEVSKDKILNYFVVNFKDNEESINNEDIKIRCLLSDTYELRECERQK